MYQYNFPGVEDPHNFLRLFYHSSADFSFIGLYLRGLILLSYLMFLCPDIKCSHLLLIKVIIQFFSQDSKQKLYITLHP